jgi:hypothetical protein
MFVYIELNPMEVTQISSFVAWLTATFVIFVLASKKEGLNKDSILDEDSSTTDLNGDISRDLKERLYTRITAFDFEELIKDVQILRQDDIMTYLRIKP